MYLLTTEAAPIAPVLICSGVFIGLRSVATLRGNSRSPKTWKPNSLNPFKRNV